MTPSAPSSCVGDPARYRGVAAQPVLLHRALPVDVLGILVHLSTDTGCPGAGLGQRELECSCGEPAAGHRDQISRANQLRPQTLQCAQSE